MELGVIFPQCEIGTDPATIRNYASTAEEVGYSHLHAYDHVLGVDTASRPEFSGPYDYGDPFHEPMTLFSHLGAVTETIEFVTGVLVLPQRQTALVAKQAAAVDVLTDGRFTLGVGVGWNEAEYEALGKSFRNRGARITEQMDVLRALWTNELVDYRGDHHRIPGLGINPLPTRQPIPIWIGGGADAVLRRAAFEGDGWLVPSRWKHPDAEHEAFERTLETVTGYLEEAGRADDEFAVVARMMLGSLDPKRWVKRVREWERAGVTHLAVSTMNAGLDAPEDHAKTIRAFRAAIECAGVTFD